MKAVTRLCAFLVIVLVLIGCGSGEESQPREARAEKTENGEREVLYWYDPMYPQQRFDQPGPSPFMDMDLVPSYADEVEEGLVRLRAGVRQTINLRTAQVRQDRLWRRIDTVGRVSYDEAGLHHLHPRVEGWIQELDVQAQGERVTAGQRLFTLYSPELASAQEEFLQALRRGEAMLIDSARQRLRSLDVQPEVISWVEENRRVREPVPWIARHDGVVSRLGVRHGMYVAPGTEIMEVADLSSVWIEAEVFDRHADWLAPGQAAEIRLSDRPGKTFDSEVAYIYPDLEPVTRTARVRLRLDNPDKRIRPGMWADVVIYAGPVEDQIIIPRQALIRTGRSQRVVVAVDDHFEVREVAAGMESGDYVAVRRGLEPGDVVVTSGQFLIDSEASLQGGFERIEAHDHH